VDRFLARPTRFNQLVFEDRAHDTSSVLLTTPSLDEPHVIA
jgi:hypothetical protein